MKKAVIEVNNLTTAYGDTIIHDNISFKIYEYETFAILGGSGSGKSTLLSALIMLNEPKSGEIKIFDQNIHQMNLLERTRLIQRCGVLFQFGALFSSLSVLENVGVMLEEYSNYPPKIITEISKMWLDRVGLGPKAYNLYPYELSGGMKKRVGLARAMVLNPEILFLDEPTSGLDPLSAERFDNLIAELKDSNPFSVVIITHDLDTIKNITDRFILLKEGKIGFEGNLQEFSYFARTNKLDKDNLFNSIRGEKFWKDA
ncbi:ATP-binding cassette domain-containing protein [Helicobacter sp. faydin-H20]|uniref:ABC transporter ATP-binding protein n=1 Tax=Helicobacter anatolicus TaxID=2905874 RepID=UPI001E3AE588|nr:ATP-binding cassette domain-containing protein [Helicobacter anatolicus]MCE3037056.1 ATP-binding cassette domain-containing protein [Helicobacter anatolicus]